MTTIKPQEVIAQALDLVEMTSATGATGFAVTSRVQDLFNRGLSKLYYILADGDLDWFSSRVTLSVSSGTAQYRLPDGVLYDGAPQFYKLKDLFLVSGGKIYAVPKFQHGEISGWEETGPRSNETLRMTYIPAFSPVPKGDWATDGPELDTPYPPGWDDYIACFIAARLSIRDEQYERRMALKEDEREALMHVMQHVAPRDVGRPDRVIDVTGRWGSGINSPFNPKFCYRLFGDYLELGQPSQQP